jgi:uncharacterized protein YbjT (DUF2867 family)
VFKQRRICLVGSTGMVGGEMIEQAISRDDIRIVGVARREVELPAGARMEMLLADPENWGDAIGASGANVLVCALGTTRAKVGGDEAAFRAVDFDLVLQCGKAAKAAGIDHMVLVSSAGADLASKNLYLRTKGEIEDALAKLHFRRLDILRPGLIRGHRQERRALEKVAMVASPIADLFLRGGARKYRSIPVTTLVQAIFALSKEKPGGRFVHEHDAMLYAIRRSIT